MGKLNARAKAGDEILRVGITSSCKGEAVSQADVSGCFRKSDGDADENLKIQASGVLLLEKSITIETGRGFGKCDGGATSLENSCWIFNCG